MKHFHTVIWIDHRVAHIFGFGRDGKGEELVRSRGPHHIHHKAGSVGSGHERDSPAYFREIAAHLGDAGTILIVGPAQTKTELNSFLQAHSPDIAAKVVGIEPLNDESEGQIISFARTFFRHSDRMSSER